jgi:BirA family biotin operon repressor/biotin-[acetyl-CoA-carboxylase] ligase
VTALGQPHRALVTVASTNDVALAWARDGAPHGAIVTADAQTAGRGRHGRTWASPPGRHLYLSLVVRLGPGIAVPPLTLAVGVGLCDGLRALGATAAGLKWPNDVLVGGRKLAGVLCESAGDAVVVGIGVNRDGAAADLPPEVAARAITLAEVVGRAVGREDLLAAVLDGLAPWIERYRGGGLRRDRAGLGGADDPRAAGDRGSGPRHGHRPRSRRRAARRGRRRDDPPGPVGPGRVEPARSGWYRPGMNRRWIAVAAVVAAAAVALLWWRGRDRGAGTSRPSGAGAAIDPEAPSAGAPGGGSAPTRPRPRVPGQPDVEIRPDGTRVYVTDKGVFRDHRGSGGSAPLGPPGLPPDQKTMSSAVTAQIYDQLKPAVVACSAAVAAADRGADPFVYVTLTVAVAGGALSTTGVEVGVNDVATSAQAALVQCVSERARAVAIPASGEPDRTDYIVQYPIRLR